MLKYIITGGTLSCFLDENGNLLPSEEAIHQTLSGYGVKESEIDIPYVIDSIHYDIKEHTSKLYDSIKSALDRGETPIVFGGTDTKIWYTTLVAKQLQQEGYLLPDSGQKAVFVSSMYSLEEKPEHIEKLFHAAKLVAKTEGLSGGLALSAEHQDAEKVDIHNVCADFDKISANMTNAFRSDKVIGYVRNGSTVDINPDVNQPVIEVPTKAKSSHLSRIAPPLLTGYDSRSLMAYLKMVGTAEPRFDGVVIEGFPGFTKHDAGRFFDNDYDPLLKTVKWLRDQNIEVIFNNKLKYNASSHRLEPLIPLEKWENDGGVRKELKDMGVRFTTGLTKDAYLNLAISDAHADEMIKPAPENFNTKGRHKVLGVRYVPDQEIMHQMVDIMAPNVKNIVFSALPNNVLPTHMEECVDGHDNTKFYCTFEHAGNQYVRGGGEVFTEQPKEHKVYAAATTTSKIIDLNVPANRAVQAIYRGIQLSR